MTNKSASPGGLGRGWFTTAHRPGICSVDSTISPWKHAASWQCSFRILTRLWQRSRGVACRCAQVSGIMLPCKQCPTRRPPQLLLTHSGLVHLVPRAAQGSLSPHTCAQPGYPTALQLCWMLCRYVQKLKQCYLFHDCTQKLLDAFLGAAQVHLYMPKVKPDRGWLA